MPNSDRNELLDYVRGIGIIFVVYGHVARGVHLAGLPIEKSLYTVVDTLIYSFHMPLFFVVSGMLFMGSFSRRGTVGFASNRAATVFYPYLVWAVIQGGMEVLLSDYTNRKTSIDAVMSILWQPHGQFWFLYALFAVSLVAAVAYRKAGPTTNIVWLFLSCGIYLLAPVSGIYFIDAIARWFVYFALGVLVIGHIQAIATFNPPVLAIVGLLMFILAQLTQMNLHLPSGLDRLNSLVCAVAGTMLVFAAATRLRSNAGFQWLAYLGRHSMDIFLLHVIMGSGARIILMNVFEVTDTLVHLTTGCLIGIIGSLLIAQGARALQLNFLFQPPGFSLGKSNRA